MATGMFDGENVDQHERSHRRQLTGGFVALFIALAVLVAVICTPVIGYLHDDRGEAKGREVLAEIKLAESWQRSTVTFNSDRFCLLMCESGDNRWWRMMLVAEGDDLAAHSQSLQAAMLGSGWGQADCVNDTVAGRASKTVCRWQKNDYHVNADLYNSDHPCPAGWMTCTTVDFTLYPGRLT